MAGLLFEKRASGKNSTGHRSAESAPHSETAPPWALLKHRGLSASREEVVHRQLCNTAGTGQARPGPSTGIRPSWPRPGRTYAPTSAWGARRMGLAWAGGGV